MIKQVFTLPRRGLVGGQPVGADYMASVRDRVKRMERACRERDVQPTANNEPQMALPFPAKATELIKKSNSPLG